MVGLKTKSVSIPHTHDVLIMCFLLTFLSRFSSSACSITLYFSIFSSTLKKCVFERDRQTDRQNGGKRTMGGRRNDFKPEATLQFSQEWVTRGLRSQTCLMALRAQNMDSRGHNYMGQKLSVFLFPQLLFWNGFLHILSNVKYRKYN